MTNNLFISLVFIYLVYLYLYMLCDPQHRAQRSQVCSYFLCTVMLYVLYLVKPHALSRQSTFHLHPHSSSPLSLTHTPTPPHSLHPTPPTPSGGTGPLSALSYSLFLSLAVLACAPLIGAIPLAALAGLMLNVAFNTFEWKETRGLVAGAWGALVRRLKGLFKMVQSKRVTVSTAATTGATTATGLRLRGCQGLTHTV